MGDKKPWYSLSAEETFAALEASAEGLPAGEVEKRLEAYGPNELGTEKTTGVLALLLHHLQSPLIYVLAAAAVVSLLAGKTIDAIVIAVIIVVNTLIGFFQEYRAERALAALQAEAAPRAQVLRRSKDGDSTEMTVEEAVVVPGDVILLEAGERVPADARIIEAVNLEIDEAMLTGESVPASKSVEPLSGELLAADWANVAFAGTNVTGGRGRAVAFATGRETEMGKIATKIETTEKARSPLQQQTYELSKKLGFLAVGAGLLILVVGYLRGYELVDLFLFVVAAAVSAIPEGLPAVMSITLAIGVNRMARRNAIIRQLPAVDTLGAATTICTDKTGTLTTNQMAVQQIFVDGRVVHAGAGGLEAEGRFEQDGQQVEAAEDEHLRLALQIAALCNDAGLIPAENDGGERREIRGDPTEGALVVAAAKAGMDKEDLEDSFPRVDEVPFSAEQKFMATFHETAEGEVHVYVKGAPETVVNFCAYVMEDGEVRELNEDKRAAILEVNTAMAEAALRVLAVAYQSMAADGIDACKEALEASDGRLIFVGLLGMMDPPRPEALEAVERCQRAGVRVVMATGDHRITGEAIAREVGILNGQEGKVLTGEDVEKMDDEELDEVVLDTLVFARVAPEHKYRIVRSLQRQGQVVAMTGDGVNDAPALKRAEIGVAMGITGTDVTKETADMVLTDDNFASIVNAVEEGRVVFQNVRKVVKFLIATNVGEILAILGALFLLPVGQLIFTPIQVLWVNLVTDGLLDITIAMEPREGDVMNERPRRPDAAIVNREIMLNVVYVALFMAVGTLWIYQWAAGAGDPARAQTMAFVTIAMFQVFNALNVRSATRSIFQLGLFSNKYLVGAIVLSVLLLILATELPLLQVALSTVSLAWQEWLPIVLVASSIFVGEELRKLVVRRGR